MRIWETEKQPHKGGGRAFNLTARKVSVWFFTKAGGKPERNLQDRARTLRNRRKDKKHESALSSRPPNGGEKSKGEKKVG